MVKQSFLYFCLKLKKVSNIFLILILKINYLQMNKMFTELAIAACYVFSNIYPSCKNDKYSEIDILNFGFWFEYERVEKTYFLIYSRVDN